MWIEWSTDLKGTVLGYGRPVEGLVDYKLRYGAVYYGKPSEDLFWDHMGEESDIVAYRQCTYT